MILGFAACANDDGIAPAQGDGSKSPIVLKASVGTGNMFTRSNPDAFDEETQAKFNIGDKIHVIDKNNNAECDYTLGSDGWAASDSKSFLKWESDKDNHFQAYYPADGNTYVQHHVEKDQSTIEGLRASDVMTYNGLSVDEPSNHVLDMEFTRWTARVVVEIASYRDQYTAEANPVNAVTVSGCYVNNSSDEQIADVKAYKVPGETQRFVALVLATAPNDDATFLTLKVKNGEGEDDLTVKGIPVLESANSYTIKLVVGKNKVSVESVTVTDWEKGDPIPGGEATDKPAKIVKLGTEVTDNATMESWLDQNIGDEKGATVALTGEFSRSYGNAIRTFTNVDNHPDADLTVDLSGITNPTEIPEHAFSDMTYSSQTCANGLTGVILPKAVTSIGANAFEYSGLKKIDLPEGITSIGSKAFGSTALETLTVPSTLVAVVDDGLSEIESLKEIRFKGNVTSFGNNAFSHDFALKSIYLDNCTAVPAVASNTFEGLNEDDNQGITVYVKDADMVSKFEADSNWNSHGFTFEVAK